MKSLHGHLLIASPHLSDPNFFRTVVFLVEHSPDGALGLVLNRVSNTSLKAVWKELDKREVASEQFLFVGGPVEGPLMALYSRSDLEGVEVIPKVYFSSEKETIEALVAKSSLDYRVFSGYAGWGPGQLEREMKLGGWLTMAARRSHVFSEFDGLWQQVTRAIGNDITDKALKIRHRPVDPGMN